MSSSGGGRTTVRLPAFTATQWQELEHQALVYKYMASGVPVPPDLLFSIRTTHHSSISSNLHMGSWNGFQMGFGRKIDPEPGRCRRTDGKKWRCSKDAYPDSKYCERHMHRGRNRSRKPVEINLALRFNTTDTNTSINNNGINKPSSSDYLGASSGPSDQTPFLRYPYFSSSRPPVTSSFSLSSPQDYRNNSYVGRGMKREIGDEQYSYALFSGGSVSNSNSNSNSNCNDSCWKMAPLAMGSSQMKHGAFAAAAHNDPSEGHSLNIELASRQQNHHEHYLERDRDCNFNTKKVMHHFLDEYPPKEGDSHDDRMSTQRTQLSIAIPNSMHDFFITQKW